MPAVMDPTLVELWNKVDLLDADRRIELQNIAEKQDNTLLISAETGEGLERFQRLSVQPDRHRQPDPRALAGWRGRGGPRLAIQQGPR